MNTAIKVYGADWCGDCRRAKRVLDRVGTPYEWVDVDVIAGAAQEAMEISGRKNIPVVVLPDRRVLVEPSDGELEQALLLRTA